MADRMAQDAWLKRKTAEAKKLADQAYDLVTKLEALPPSEDLLNREMALQKITDSVILTIGKKLSPLQNQAAYLLGAGFEFVKAANAVGIDLTTLYEWHQTIPEFRHAYAYYQEVAERDIGNAARREIQLLLEESDMATKDRLGLIKIMTEISKEPDKRWSDKIGIMQKQQTIEQNAKQSRVMNLRINNIPKESIDAEFTVIEDDGEE